MMTCRICGKRFVVTWPQHWVYRRKDVFLCSEDCMIVYDVQTTRAANGFGPKKKGAEENMAGKLTQKQRDEAVEIAIQGGSPIEYLKKCGIANPYASWDWIKKSLAKKDPQKYAKLEAGGEKIRTVKDVAEEITTYADEVVKRLDAGIEKPAEVIKVDKVPAINAQEIEQAIKNAPEVKIRPMVEIPEQQIQPLGLQGGVNYQLKVEESRKARKAFKVIGLETDFGRFTVGKVDGVIRFEAEGNTEISMVTEDWVKMAALLPEILRELGVDA